MRDFPGGLVAKMNAGGPGQETRSHMEQLSSGAAK